MALFRKRKDDDPVDPEAFSERLGIKNKDLLVLGQLLQGGADLTQPRHALYFLYFPSAPLAEAAAARAVEAGYRAGAREPRPDHPGEWCVVAERDDVVLDPPAVRAADELFQGIADDLGGEFDGWEAALEP